MQRAREKNPNTRSGRRARKLIQIVFGQDADPEAQPFGTLRYQLLTAAAGTVLQAASDGADRAVLIVHEIRSPDVDANKVATNEMDMAAFLSVLHKGPVRMQPGVLFGPWRMSIGGEDVAGVELLVGKIVT